MTLRTTGFRLIERALPRTVENLRAIPGTAASASEATRRVDELAATVRRLEGIVTRQRARIDDLERSRAEAEQFGPRIAELTDALAVELGRPPA